MAGTILCGSSAAHALTGPQDPAPGSPLAQVPAALGTDGIPDATRSNRARRGLTLPTPRQLFGRNGARALRIADRALLASPRAARARAAQAGAPPLHSVGSAGNVKVASGSSEATPAADGGSAHEVTYVDRIRGRGAEQRRSIQFAVSADNCPTLVSRGLSGEARGKLRAEQRILTIETKGRYRLTTEFVAELTGTRDIAGYVGKRADLSSVAAKGTMYLTLRRVRRLYDTRTHRSWREKPLVLRYEVLSIYGSWIHDAHSDFEEFIRRYAGGNDSDPADDIRSDKLLNYPAFEAVAKEFIDAVEARVAPVYEAAEKNWQTPGRCVDVTWDAPESLVPGQAIKLTAHAVSKKGQPVELLADPDHSFVPFKDDLLTVAPFDFVSPDASAGATFTVTPPSEPWPADKPRALVIRFLSRAGVGEVWKEFPAAAYPIRYRVLSASIDALAQGSDPGPACADLGGTSGKKRFIGTPTGQVTEDPENKLDRPPGSDALLGRVSGWVNAAWTEQQLKGCKYDPDNPGRPLPCEETAPDEHPLPDGRWPVGFGISTSGAPAGQAKLSWSLLYPSVGSRNLCQVFINGKSVPADKLTQVVSLSRLMSSEPQTFTISGSHHADTDLINQPVSLDYNWTMSITIQRVG